MTTRSAESDTPPVLQTPGELLDTLMQIRRDISAEAASIVGQWSLTLDDNRRQFTRSADNLAQYLALRRRDLRDIQDSLRPWGLSSLGRIEAQVMPNLDAVIATLAQLCGQDATRYAARPQPDEFAFGSRLLENETEAVLGKPPRNRYVRMMVTLDSRYALDFEYVRQMVTVGMNVARINCAHDGPNQWAKMIANVRRAEQVTGYPCKVSMDLAGPKCRTADILQPRQHRLRKGDVLLLTPDNPEKSDEYETQARCTLPEALAKVAVGAQVWFDDGRIGTEVEARQPRGIRLRVTVADDEGEKLKEDKGINFPGTDLELSPLTDKDREDLDFIVRHADIVNYSFVQRPDDVRLIQREIAERNASRKIVRSLALVAKIETALAVKNLPEIIVTAAGAQPFGVMIARGDLAVEIGFERLAEMQEEIMWLCEAAHVPVIWATQVLETLAKTGRPTRAEITDAAMSERAECVMLNKGKYILDAMKILDDVLMRMEAHQSKKVARLRALRSW
jgi:pyruvate kinase